jgi:hypothetical protein
MRGLNAAPGIHGVTMASDFPKLRKQAFKTLVSISNLHHPRQVVKWFPANFAESPRTQ